jgi:tetratricopeptide (TPR) repeat protein
MLEAAIEPLEIPTYPVGEPEKNPVFFEKRVYQGSSGKVYPVPFIDKVCDEPRPMVYRSARLENEFVRLVMLPEIGGRIFIGQDKTNRDYDFFYRQDVIKPALVGLAGPWISGGVEFNWPQHHRPGTFLPADLHLEEEEDGARTFWFSEHDPLDRLKGMHGIRLRPGSALVELRARLYNRTPFTRTFLWWANVAARVHDQYQSFFPPDVHYVADHAVRALSSFPLAENPYYGVDYQNRPGANDLAWYRNIPVPTSYMVCQTRFDFFGGYDHAAGGGFVHVADRHIAPGKKQWTWGNHPFGWAWDRELTDENGPYVELMAGVHTDNQPDFSYLLPYETKTFTQCWWPLPAIGPVQQANRRAALRLVVAADRRIGLALCAPAALTGRLTLSRGGEILLDEPVELEPGSCWRHDGLVFAGENECELEALLRDADGRVVLAYRPVDRATLGRGRARATEPPPPADIASADELFLTGEHLEQYRHPTRDPEAYWREALRRDPGDARCNLALGRRMLQDILAADPLDHWAAYVRNRVIPASSRNDAQTILDIAFDFIDAGFNDEALALLDAHHKAPVTPVAVPNPLERTAMTHYLRAWLTRDPADLAAARRQPSDYFFPSRLHEQLVLEWAIVRPGADPAACFALGNYYYDLRRHQDAISVWQLAVDDGTTIPTVFRNLGIALWNTRHDGGAARKCYLRALQLDENDPRMVSEYDQLRAKLNDPLADRLAFLESHRPLVLERDDCTIALAGLYNLTGDPGKALEIVTSRRFHPWEGGEGAVLRQFTTAHLLLGRKALDNGDAATALDHFTGAMQTPESLGEAYHLLQAKADVNYWIGRALKALGRLAEAEDHFNRSAGESGDFSEMAVTAHSPLTYFRGLSLRELGHEDQAIAVCEDLKAYATAKLGETADRLLRHLAAQPAGV